MVAKTMHIDLHKPAGPLPNIFIETDSFVTNPSSAFTTVNLQDLNIDSVPIYKMVAVTLITCLVILGNVLTLVTIWRTKALHTHSGCFLGSMSIAYLLYGFVGCFSVHAAFSGHWPHDPIIGQIIGYITTFSLAASLYALTVMSIDLYIRVQWPLRYLSIMTTRKCITSIVFCWLFPMALFSPLTPSWHDLKCFQETTVCTVDWAADPGFTFTVSGILLIPCCIIIGYCWLKIFLASRKQVLRLSQVHYVMSVFSPTKKLCVPMERKGLLALLAVVMVFYISWLPYFILQAWKSLHVHFNSQVLVADILPDGLEFGFTWLAMSNAFTNCVVYSLLNKHYKQGVKALLNKVMCRLDDRSQQRRVTPWDLGSPSWL